MIISTKAIILKNIKYGDSSLILHAYTAEKGLRNYIVSGVRSTKSKIPAAAFQVGNMLDIIAYEKYENQLNRIKEINIQTVFKDIPFNIKKGAITQLMMEIVGKCIQEVEPNPVLFNFLADCLLYLDSTNDSIRNFHLYFLVQFSAFLGFSPGGKYIEGSFFDQKEGIFTFSDENITSCMNPILSSNLYLLSNSSIENYHKIEMERQIRDDLFFALEKFYQFHLENLKPFECFRIWKELL